MEKKLLVPVSDDITASEASQDSTPVVHEGRLPGGYKSCTKPIEASWNKHQKRASGLSQSPEAGSQNG